jgi:hypothetical protein
MVCADRRGRGKASSLTQADSRGKIEPMRRRIVGFLAVVKAVALYDSLIVKELSRSEPPDVATVMEELGR